MEYEIVDSIIAVWIVRLCLKNFLMLYVCCCRTIIKSVFLIYNKYIILNKVLYTYTIGCIYNIEHQFTGNIWFVENYSSASFRFNLLHIESSSVKIRFEYTKIEYENIICTKKIEIKSYKLKSPKKTSIKNF